MSLRVLHHGRCFDGVVSAALALRLLRELGHDVDGAETEGQTHRRGPAFDPDAFRADVNVVVDYRYASDPRLTWWFDHHATTFTSDADRAHSEKRDGAQHVFDPDAPSCAGLIHRVAAERFGLDLAPTDGSLVQWADRIDTASFRDAAEAVQLASPPLQLMHWLETAATPQTEPRVVAALAQGVPMEQILTQPWVSAGLDAALAEHQDHVDRVRRRIEAEDRVAWIDLGDVVLRGINKFIPYDALPELQVAVMVLQMPDRVKVSVGTNPWAPRMPDLDVGALCRRYGGGGHAVVGAVSLPVDRLQEGREIGREIVTRLRLVSRLPVDGG